jgi:hypothetical protein
LSRTSRFRTCSRTTWSFYKRTNWSCARKKFRTTLKLVRRLGIIGINSALIEFDIYGNINSTHLMRHADDERYWRFGRLCPQCTTFRFL